MAITVLVADDHAVLADALSLALRQWYHVPAPVTSLRLLRQAVTIAQPEAVLLDLTFGTECALSHLPELLRLAPGTRFIVFTNHEEEAFEIASRRAGAHGFLIKTVDMTAVRQAIDAGDAAPPDVPVTDRARTAMTARERAQSQSQELVQWMLVSGYTHAAIAEHIGITIKGVEYHAARLRGDATRTSVARKS